MHFSQEFSICKTGIHHSYNTVVNIQCKTRLLIIAIVILIGNQSAKEPTWSEMDVQNDFCVLAFIL